MSAKTDAIARQAQWARAQGLNPDSRGYLANCETNLFRPLSARARACFLNGSGNELQDAGDRPAKMRAAHSSSALAVNVFDYWSDSPNAMLSALDLPMKAVSLAFETQFGTRLPGNPPNLDVCFVQADGAVIGVESKFTEWLTPKPAGKELFKPKYFSVEAGLWASKGLVRAQALAEDLRSGRKKYRYLDAAQLLKHSLGLACSRKPFALVYLYFDVDGEEAVLHAREVRDFAANIGQDFPFYHRTYQAVFERMQDGGSEHTAYLGYLKSRYFARAKPHGNQSLAWSIT